MIAFFGSSSALPSVPPHIKITASAINYHTQAVSHQTSRRSIKRFAFKSKEFHV
jgi:hypothetical protein